MQGNWRRLIVYKLFVLIMFTLVPAVAFAGDSGKISLEQAILSVRGAFDIPKEYTEFSSSYNSYGDTPNWSLYWRSADERAGGSFSATVDAVTGEVINMYTWQYEGPYESGMRVPLISEAEAKRIAEGLIKKVLPQRLDSLELQPGDNQIISLAGYDRPVYRFRWQRVENGIMVTGDGAEVAVRGDNGSITNYNLQWSKSHFPASSGAIIPQQARQIFEDSDMLELQYFLPSAVKSESGKIQQPILVYRLSHPSNGIIDALKGEPVVPEKGKWYRDMMEYGGMGSDMRLQKSMADEYSGALLTPEEMKEIERTAALMNQEEAIAVVKRWIEIGEGMTLRYATLYADWQFPEIRVWNFHWGWEEEKTEPPQGIHNISARVNAVTGELIGFDMYSYTAEPTTKQGAVDRETARKIAEDFLNKIQPQRFKQVKLIDNYDPGWDPIPLEKGQNPTSQYFNYARQVNGVIFPANGMNVRVDTVNRRITNFSLEWKDFTFPDPRGVLGKQRAVEAFLKHRPLTIAYTPLYSQSGLAEMKLVYLPSTTPEISFFNIIDARTGEPLDWQGNPIARMPRAYRFDDIEGNFAEKEISLLGRAGIFGEYGSKFRPGEEVTTVSLLRAMLIAREGIWGKTDMSDDEILREARTRKWLQEEAQPGDKVTREYLAKLMIRMINLEKAAKIEGIYQVPFKDANALSPGSTGYAVLAWGLGILKGDGVSFLPERRVTRAEAAVSLVRALANSI